MRLLPALATQGKLFAISSVPICSLGRQPILFRYLVVIYPLMCYLDQYCIDIVVEDAPTYSTSHTGDPSFVCAVLLFGSLAYFVS